MAFPSPTNPKSELRREMRQRMQQHCGDPAPVRDAVTRFLEKDPGLHQLAVFSPLPGEVDLMDLLLRHPQKTWVFPKVRENSLTFHRVQNPSEELIPGAFGILEPSPALAEIPIHEIDAFFCPGLAFDGNGGRLGRGRGFYDRVLAGARDDALKIGVCFPYQLVADTFGEGHDIKMDTVICGV